MSVEISPAEVRAVARGIGTVAGEVEGVDLSDPLAHIRHGLPGSESAPAASALQTEVDQDQRDWVKFARDHADTMRKTADAFDAVDQFDKGRMHRLMDRLNGVGTDGATVEAPGVREGYGGPE